MSLGIQDDDAFSQTGTFGTSALLDRADAIDAGWVRVMVVDTRWNAGQDGEYVRAVAEAKARGKRVMASLLAWRTQPTAAEWRAYTRRVVARMAPYVDAWSVMNEPNWPGMNAATGTACMLIPTPISTPIERTVDGVKVQRVWRHVRKGKGTHRRVRRGHRRHYVMVKARTRRAKHLANWKRVTRKRATHANHVEYVTTNAEATACRAETFGEAYRRVYDVSAPIIQGLDPDARIVVGDLCPCNGDDTFMDAFYAKGKPDVRPDAFGFHPYPGVDYAVDAVRYARSRGLASWATEWGLSAERSPSPADWVRALRAFDRAGVELTFIYDTRTVRGGDTWDTQMRTDDVAAVAAR